MPAEKEKSESTEKPASAPSTVDTVSAPPDKVAGPQPLARATDKLQQGGAPERARMAGAMQQNVGNSRVGRMMGAGVQRKADEKAPRVSSPDDHEEKEADHVAEKVMRTSNNEAGATSAAAPATTSAGAPGAGGGQPLSKADREFMEPRFGRSFEDVRLHTDNEAQQQATGIGAKAFTSGSDISFGPGSGPGDKKLLAHELTHVAQQEGNEADKSVKRAPGPLTPAQEAAAVRFNRGRYDERSIRIIQLVTGTAVDGRFGDISAQAVAVWQVANGLTMNGQVDAASLNQMVLDRAAGGLHEHAIQLCIDFHNLNVRRDTLSVQFDDEGFFEELANRVLGTPEATVTFGPGNTRVIHVSPRAFDSEPTLFAAINAQLTAPAPAVPPLGPRPTLLTPAQERSAINFNRSHFTDRRSVLAIQGHVAANPDGRFGPDTVERIANYQTFLGITVDGKVGEGTLEIMVGELVGLDFHDAAIRLIVDFYNFDEANLLDIFFDPTETDNATTDARPNEPVRIAVGPTAFTRPFPNLVHTIAHEYEHVRQHRRGIGAASQPTREFLGEAIEILSVGMQQEDLESVAPPAPGAPSPTWVPGFASDATRALTMWNAMTGPEQHTHRLRFIAVRNRVRARIAAGTAAQQALHAPMLANYNAVVVPP
jgi:peptidoglycan hydrolase-like protein with peptidoglycan-binding domain